MEKYHCYFIDDLEGIKNLQKNSPRKLVPENLRSTITELMRGGRIFIDESRDEYFGGVHHDVHASSGEYLLFNNFVMLEDKVVGYYGDYQKVFLFPGDENGYWSTNSLTFERATLVYEPNFDPDVLEMDEDYEYKDGDECATTIIVSPENDVYWGEYYPLAVNMRFGKETDNILGVVASKLPNLQRIDFDGTMRDWLSLTFGIRDSNPCLTGADLYINNQLLPRRLYLDFVTISTCAFCGAKIEEIIFGPHVRHIEEDAFYGCGLLRKVTFNAGIKSIGKSAFRECDLEEVILPDSLVVLGEEAFMMNRNLKRLSLSSQITTIPKRAFAFTAFEELSIPEAVEEIGESAFRGCTALKKLDLPESLRKIGKSAFSSTDALEEVAFPKRLTFLGDEVFYAGESIRKVVFLGKGPDKIPDSAFQYCPNLEEIVLPSELIEIEDEAFQGAAIRRIDLPSSVRVIGGIAFYDCKNLEELSIPEGVTTFKCVVDNFDNLKTINIPSSVTLISFGISKGTASTTIIYDGDIESFAKVEFHLWGDIHVKVVTHEGELNFTADEE